MIKQEIFKDVIGYEGIYQVSNLGNVYSLPREWKSANGNSRKHNGKLLSQKNRGRYPRVILCKNGIIKHYCVHVLMAQSFLNYDVKKGFVVDHINNISKDNRLENLQIITHRKNSSKDKIRKNNLPTGVEILANGKYRARITKNYKSIHLGVYNCVTTAYLSYLKNINR